MLKFQEKDITAQIEPKPIVAQKAGNRVTILGTTLSTLNTTT